MSQEPSPAVYYHYQEARCVLDVRYNSETRQVTIRGGRHAYALLAENCMYNADLEQNDEHDHWWLRTPGSLELILVLKGGLKSMDEPSVDAEPPTEEGSRLEQFVDIAYIHADEKVAIAVDATSKPGTVFLVADKKGMAWLAGMLTDFLLVLEPEQLSYTVQDNVDGLSSVCVEFDASLDAQEYSLF